MIWRPVAAGHGRLLEVRYKWSIDDLLDSHEVLDMKEEAEAAMLEKARRPT